MSNVKIILKSGYEIKVSCEKFKVKYSSDTSISGYEVTNIAKNSNSPLHIDVNEIAAVVEIK